MIRSCPAPAKGGIKKECTNNPLQDNGTSLILKLPKRHKELCPQVLSFIVQNPGSTLREIQAKCGYPRGDPTVIKQRWIIFDITEILLFAGYIRRSNFRYYPTTKGQEMTPA